MGINEILDKTQTYTAIKLKEDELYKKKGSDYKLPSKFLNLNAIYDKWTYERLADEISLDSEEKEIIRRCRPEIYFCYVFSTKVWDRFNNSLGVRGGVSIMNGGIVWEHYHVNELGGVFLKKNEIILKAISADPYLKERKSPTEAEQ